ncbi:MAG: GvpL/GvpF family gas vesicle protein [Chlamydiota bacterium]
MSAVESGKKGLIYLYCVAEREPAPVLVPGLAAAPVAVCHHGLYAVVSAAAETEFGEEGLKKHLSDFEWVKTKATIHNTVIGEVMKGGAVVPFKLGTIFNTDANLRSWLEKYEEELEDLLHELHGREEWGLKLYCDTGTLRSFLGAQDKEAAQMDKEIASSSVGKAFLLKKKRDEALTILVDKKLNEYGQEIYARLCALSVRARINKLLPREVTERNDDMILNAVFLVDRNAVGGFIDATKDFKDRFSSPGLSVDCTGPWPPYNFCELSEKHHGG